jgi:hypothetical protein
MFLRNKAGGVGPVLLKLNPARYHIQTTFEALVSSLFEQAYEWILQHLGHTLEEDPQDSY